MAKSRTKKDFEFKPFESMTKTAKYLRITNNMMESKAWNQLSCYAMVIYLHIKSKYNHNNADNISLTYSEAGKLMNKRTFTKAIDELINHGFIELLEQNWTARRPNIYGLSSMWQHYGTSCFKVKQRQKREAPRDKTKRFKLIG